MFREGFATGGNTIGYQGAGEFGSGGEKDNARSSRIIQAINKKQLAL